MNSSSHSPSCNQFPFSSVVVPEWRPDFLTSEISATLISLTIVNLLLSPSTIFLNTLVILAVKTTRQLRNKYNALLACLAGTDILTDALGQPLFIAELIYRLTGSLESEFCIPHAARSFSRTSALISLQYLALISTERYISIKFPVKYDNFVTKRRFIGSVVLAWFLVSSQLCFHFTVIQYLGTFFICSPYSRPFLFLFFAALLVITKLESVVVGR